MRVAAAEKFLAFTSESFAPLAARREMALSSSLTTLFVLIMGVAIVGGLAGLRAPGLCGLRLRAFGAGGAVAVHAGGVWVMRLARRAKIFCETRTHYSDHRACQRR